MSIKKLLVEELKINPVHPAFAKLPQAIYPDVTNRKISFELLGVGTEYANAIRVCTMEEIEWHALEVDETQIKYDDPNREPDIIIAEFCKRIGLIPIRQDISDDARFSLHVANTGKSTSGTSPDAKYRIVYTGDLKLSSGSKKYDKPFDSRFRLVALSPGKVIEVNNIKVVKGYGYQNAKFSTCSFEYRVLDHIDAYYLSDKEQITSHMTTLKDIRAQVAGKSATSQSRVIIIPDPSIIASCSDRIRDKVKNNFDIILEDSKIQPISSSIARPMHFHLAFTFFCEVDPKEILIQSLQTLKDRLNRIRESVEGYIAGNTVDKPDGVEKSFIEINMPGGTSDTSVVGNDIQVPSVLIRSEDHVIGNLIVKTVLELVPLIPMINYKIIHPSNRSVLINIMHSQPLKVLVDALTQCWNVFDALQKQIV
jgi:DNA-directed RNA polymerase subunit L